MRRILPLFALALLPGAAASAAASEKTAPPRFAETTSVVAVEVPVEVTADGQPVRGLTANDFEVYDGRQKQTLTGFEVIDLKLAPAAAAAPTPVPIAGRRHFLLLFDLMNSEPAALASSRQAVLKMVGALQPSDLVAVATYSRSHAARIVLGFTSDRRQVEAAIARLDSPQLYDRSLDPLSLVVQEMEQESQAPTAGAASDRPGAGREGMALDEMRDAARASERNVRQQQVGDVAALTRSFAELAHMLASARGRKYVVYLSEGFDSSLLVGRQENTTGTAQERDFGSMWTGDSDQTFGSSKVQNDLERMLAEFRRTDCVIQAVDIGRLRAGGDQAPRASGIDTLVMMAKDTGGEIYQNYNDLGAAMGKMLERTSVTYLLTFQPDDLKPDGKYRKLTVKLKNGPKGAEIVYRPGYYAPLPFAQQAALERRLQTAELVVGAQDAGTIDAAVLAAPFRVGGEKAYVPLIVEVDGRSLLAGQSGDVVATELYAYAFDDKGEVRAHLVQSLGFDLKKVRGALEQSGFKFYGHLELAPGSYSVRVVVRNGSTGAAAMRVLPLTVAASAESAPIVLPPFFPEPPGRWLMVREPQGQGQPAVPYPFIGKQDAFIPAAGPRVPGQGDTAVCVMAYNLGDASLAVEGHLEGPDGKPVAGGKLKISERVRSASGADRLLGSLHTEGVPPGRYTLRVQVKSGGREVPAPPVAVEVTAGSGAAGAP